MNYKYAMLSNVGNRDINEDSIGYVESDGIKIFIICDGLGGHGKGDLASKFIVEFIKSYISELQSFADDWIEQMVIDAHDALLIEQRNQNSIYQMKTTLSLLIINEAESWYQILHCGDTRVYTFKNKKYVRRTIDHSVPQMLVIAGDIKEKHIRNHPDRNRLLKVLGVNWDKPMYELSERFKLYDDMAFLLCTDGFWEYILEKEMVKTLKRASNSDEWIKVMEEIVKVSGLNSNMDNYSAIAVMNENEK